MPARLLKILLSLPFMIAAGVFGFYLVFGFFLVDPVAKKLLPWIGEEKLASQLSVQKVMFNPLTLEATVQGLKLAERNGQELASIDRLYVNLETYGLFRLAWRMKDVELSGPHADFLVRQGGKLNWSDLIARLNEDNKPPMDTMPRVLIDRIKIENGEIKYTEANRSGEPFHVHLQPLGIELDGLSTLPEDRGSYVVAAKLSEHGGTLKWKGDVSLNPVQSDGEVALEGVSVTGLLNAIKIPRNFELPSGTLAADTHYRFALVEDKSGKDKSAQYKPWLRINSANLVLQNLALAPRGGGAPVFEFAEGRVGNANLNLAARKLDIAEFSLKTAKLAATRQPNGTLDWQTLFAVADEAPASAVKPQQKPGDKTATEPPWKVSVQGIHLEDWTARFTDNSYARPLRVEAAGFGLEAKLEGEVGSAPAAILVGPINASLGPVRVFSGLENVAELGSADLTNANFDLAAKDLGIESIDLAGVKTALVLGKNKQLNWNTILARHPNAPKPAAASSRPGQRAMRVKLGRLGVEGIQVAVSDQSTPMPVKLDIVNGHAQLKNLSLDLDKFMTLEAVLNVKQGGKLSASGSVVPGKRSGKLNIKLTGLLLKPFAPYVNQFARLDLQSGALFSSGKLGFAKDKKGMKLNYDGGFSVNELAIIEEETAEAFLSWETLSSDNLKVSLSPNKLHITELVAVKPFSKIIIFEDKSINLKRILRKPAEPAVAAKAAGAKTASGKAKNAGTGPPKAVLAKPAGKESGDSFPIAIERLRIDNANVEFADLSLVPQFGTRMYSLSGIIAGLSTDPATMALVELDGRVDEYGTARVRGTIQPFRATDFTDLTLTFRNLEMANLTPYSGKFAGRRIESGRLSADLEYKVKQRQLSGNNKFVINKIKLGERVDSPDALKLPLDLAIALLEDSEGNIDLDMPISGSLDDPQFSYGKIVWKAIVNVLTKLVTAPFRAIGNLLGISHEKLEAIEFDFGETELAPPEKEKLKNIGLALAKRPALTITFEPGYEIKGDTRAIQEMWIRRDVANRMGLKTEAGQEPGPVDTTNPRAQQALEFLYDSRFAKKGGLDAFKKEYEKPKEGAKSMYADMLERLTLIIPVSEDELKRLAQQRGEAVRRELVDVTKVDSSRMSIGASTRVADGGKMVASKISLGTSRKLPVKPSPATAPVPAAP